MLEKFISDTLIQNCEADEYGYKKKPLKKAFIIKKVLDWIKNNIFIDLCCFKKHEYIKTENTILNNLGNSISYNTYNEEIHTPSLKDKTIVVSVSEIQYTKDPAVVLYSDYDVISLSCSFPVKTITLGGKVYDINVKNKADWKILADALTKAHIDKKYVYIFDEDNCVFYTTDYIKTYIPSLKTYNIENYYAQNECIEEEDVNKLFEEINKL